MFWMETPTPDLKQAEEFSVKIRKYHPKKLLSYNLSPSFNWDAFNMKDEQIISFCSDLGKLGFTWQFITLAGFHFNALISEKFSRDLSQN
jgi:isocitrate lyase